MNKTDYPPHTSSPEELAARLSTNLQTGLSASEILLRLKKWGFNVINQQAGVSPWRIFLNQLKNPITYLLVVAACLSFLFQEWLDGSAILVVIVLNATIGFLLEFRASKSMEALRKMTLVPAKVVRESRLEEISSENVVPGDILFLEAGDMVPADARITNLVQFEVNEAALTGESLPVAK